MKPRRTELGLLIVAWAIGAVCYATVDLATLGELPVNTVALLIGSAAILLIGHIVVRRLAPHADPVLFPVAAMINLLGLVMIHRLDVAERLRAEANDTKPPSSDAVAQATWVLVALVLFTLVLFFVTDHRKLQRYTFTSLVAGVVLLLLPLLPIVGTSINGARLWIRLGPLSFQPSELAKVALTIFFAGYLVRKREALATVRRKFLGLGFPRGRDFGPLLVAWLLALGVLAFERDLGTALMFFGVFVILLYVSTQRRSWLIIGAALFALAAVLGYLAFGHVRLRVQIWLDPWAYANDQGYQLVQALFGLASGGLFGTGLGQGYPLFIPFAKTDFISAALGEELGLAGMMALIMLFAILVERGLRTGIACRDPFGTLLAVGLSSVFALQVFVTIGGVTRLIPLTGLTTPFLSYGGSALVVNWMMVALLLRISDRNRRPAVIAQSADEALTQMIRVGIDR
ncbi:MAG: FtsW/RodA/SpoVE family cell cycle protein [Candidatus Nanopelagicales bacterium]|nr:FtsW/RodA/SpoVE family cell cycle protein [Candidatus Nanopelagicales bacterium]MCU0299751.1 FtsW/RodA/SpoVE family cell cycle protein [Candidatus Nanopelagicales bacterium]